MRESVVASPGVHNVTALGNLITWQKVDYDFSYHQMEFPCNINVLITSEGRSLLPVRQTSWVWGVTAAGRQPLAQSRGGKALSRAQGGMALALVTASQQGLGQAKNVFEGEPGAGASPLLGWSGWGWPGSG